MTGRAGLAPFPAEPGLGRRGGPRAASEGAAPRDPGIRGRLQRALAAAPDGDNRAERTGAAAAAGAGAERSPCKTGAGAGAARAGRAGPGRAGAMDR